MGLIPRKSKAPHVLFGGLLQEPAGRQPRGYLGHWGGRCPGAAKDRIGLCPFQHSMLLPFTQTSEVPRVSLISVLMSPTIYWLISNLLPTNMQMSDKHRFSASVIIRLMYKPLSSLSGFLCVCVCMFMHQGFYYF